MNIKQPTPQQIIAARHAVNKTQSQCAAIVHTTLRAWQMWEAGDRKMPTGLWELFLLKTGQIKLVKV